MGPAPDWNQFTAKELGDEVASVVIGMIQDRDRRIRELERQIGEQQVLIDGLERDLDLADAKAVKHG